MSRLVTCTLCGAPVDDADTVDMPNGVMCYDPCYLWVESMMEQADEIEDDGEEFVFEFEAEEGLFDDDDEDDGPW